MYNLWYFVAFYAVLLQKVLFFAIYAVFRKIGLLQFTRYCVEKILAQISDRGEKMTNMRYGHHGRVFGMGPASRSRSVDSENHLGKKKRTSGS